MEVDNFRFLNVRKSRMSQPM